MSEVKTDGEFPETSGAPKNKKHFGIVAAVFGLVLAVVAAYFLYFRVTVPNVGELTAAEATSQIESAGLKIGSVTKEFSADFPAGEVLSQYPTNPDTVNRGAAVDLVISKGPELRDINLTIRSTGTAFFGVSGDCNTGLTMTNSVHDNADLVLTDRAGGVHSTQIHVVSSLENACTFAATIPQVPVSKAPFTLSLGGDVVHPATGDVFGTDARKPLRLTGASLRGSNWKVSLKCYIVCFAQDE